MGAATTTQQRFQYFNDDGTESGATTKASVDTDWVPGVSDLDTPFRLRFEVGTTGMNESNRSYNIFLSVDGGAYAQITTTSTNGVISVASGHSSPPADNSATTERMAGAGTFQAGQWDNTGTTGNIAILVNQETEIEFCLQLDGANLSGGEQLDFRCYGGGAALDAYTITPRIASAPTPAAGEIQQSHFRIRNIGGLQTINQNSDWAAAIDVDVTLDAVNKDGGCLFGVRFELEEINSASKTITPKIQYRVNAGTWTDLRDVGTVDDYVTPGNSTGIYNVIVVNKATISDGAATTNILSGSAKAFVAGTGEHNTIGAGITLNNQHTEIEWRVLIRNRYNAPSVRQQSIDGDEYEFRVVESDNTILGGTYVIPKVTLNLPNGYIGGTGMETYGNFAFIAIPDGTLYAPIESAEIGADFVMLKSIDGGNSWLQQDAGTAVDNDMESWAMAYDDTNKVIHCAHVSGACNYFQWATKDHATVPDTWITARTVELEASVDSINQSCDIIIRDDGGGDELYVFYPDSATTDQVFYRKKPDLTTGTFAARVSIDVTGGTTDFSGIAAVLGPNSNDIHLFYNDYSNANLHHRTLDTADALGTIHTCESDMPTSNDSHHGTTNAICWYDGANENAMIGYIPQTGNILYTVIVVDDGTPDARQDASNSVAVLENPTGINSRQPVASLALDGTTAWVMYADNATQDIWRASNADGAGWTGHTEQQDAVVMHGVRAQVYENAGGDTILGYLWETTYNQDGASPRSGFTGTSRYDEYVIALAATGNLVPWASHAWRRRQLNPIYRM